MILNKNNICYLAIPKNASSSITNHFRALQWQEIELSNITPEHTLCIILRDPYKRWISGFVEDIYNYCNNDILKDKIIGEIKSKDNWFLDWIFFSKSFDIGFHTKLQKDCMHVPLSLPKETIFFKLENNLNFKLHHWLVGEGIQNNFLQTDKQNVKQDLQIYKIIQAYLFDAKNQDKKDKLLKYLKPDYDFINSIKFY
jgi:hypothetical protein